MRDTKQAFVELQRKKTVSLRDYKIRGLYSYNILDHPDYIKCSKIEKRIVNYVYTMKVRESVASYIEESTGGKPDIE